MSENIKIRPERVPSGSQGDRPDEASEADDAREAARIDDAESQMRKALGLLGEAPRHRPEPERNEQAHRVLDRFGGAPHRRRFVQDGDVPVTVLRRDAHHDPAGQRAVTPTAPPTTSRLQRVEAALAAEIAAREKADRLLTETQAVVRDLQTKIGHAELARTDAVDALRRERETLGKLTQDAASSGNRLNDMAMQLRCAEQSLLAAQEQFQQEQRSRRDAERALKSIQAAPRGAEAIGPALSDDRPALVPATEAWSIPARRLSESASISPAIRRRRAAEPAVAEQEPVKWWLTVKPLGKRKQ